MISRLQRFDLRSHPDFFRIFRKVHSESFTVFYQHSQTFQVAVVVSKKVAKSAVVRNKNKRRMKAILLKNQEILKNRICVVVLKKDVSQLEFKVLRVEVEKVIDKVVN